MRRARRAKAGLTEVVARQRGREAVRCSGVRRHPHRREGQRRHQLALRATEEDERGEGPKSGNGGGLVGLTMEGGKRAEEGRGGSIAGVDERWLAWPCTEECEGEKKERRTRRHRAAIF
jgi:hypothetical protein